MQTAIDWLVGLRPWQIITLTFMIGLVFVMVSVLICALIFKHLDAMTDEFHVTVIPPALGPTENELREQNRRITAAHLKYSTRRKL